MAVQIQFRRDTAANWTSVNPTLSLGEMGLETDTGQFKIGNGTLAWNSLSYAQMGPSGLQQGATAPSYTTTLWLDTSATADGVAVNSTLPVTSGGYFKTAWTVATGTAATNGTLYYTPFYVPTQTTIAEIGGVTTTVTTTGNCRMGIYSDLNGQPNALVYDSNTKAYTGNNNFQNVTGVATTLSQGWYWLAFVQQTGNSTWLGVSASQVGSLVSQRLSANNVATVVTNFTQTGITATLPSTATPVLSVAAAPIAIVRTA